MIRSIPLITMGIFIVPAMTERIQASSNADVIVYGSTPGGFCAAIAAAREGASVILLEPTNHIGGLSTGGLSHCDSNQMVRTTVMGLFDEWHRRIVKDYTDRGLKAPYNPEIKDNSKWTFEPQVAMRVTKKMLREAGVTVHTERYLQSVNMEGSRILSLVTKKGNYAAKIYVDGTYEGDLMAAAGVQWRIGRESRSEYNESYAGKQYPKNKMNINGFDKNGTLLPLVTADDGGPNATGDEKIMTYSFRLCLTEIPENRIPMPKPENYDPSRFEIIRRHISSGQSSYGFDLYPLPGQKFDGNNSIGRQFSIGLVGGGNDWHNANQERRKAIWEKHKQYTLEFFHFLTTDPAVPGNIRSKYAKLGLCKDEFKDHSHFSPALYVRESRRMIGMHVITQRDIIDQPRKNDPIAISSFPIDSHDVQRIALKDGGVINEGTIFPVRVKGQPFGFSYHVPYRSLLPKPNQCSNLLVPVALSCTHVGISSLRIEGTWMIIGQSAGIAAALSAKNNLAVQDLPYSKLKTRLLAQGQELKLPARHSKLMDLGAVMDDSKAELRGIWKQSSLFYPHVGEGYIHDDKRGDGKSTATFSYEPKVTGIYEILMSYSAHESRAKNIPVVIMNGSDQTEIIVDQTQPIPNGQFFRVIGRANLDATEETQVIISNRQTDGFIIVDAIKLRLIDENSLKAHE